jgi:carboxymethylenebutenolidase
MYLNAQALALALLTLTALPSESQAIKIHMHDAGGYAADGMLYKPSGQPPFAAIVLLPDKDGITARIQESAKRFAAAGYFTVAIDPNRGMPSDLAQISEQDKQHDVEAALAFIDAQTEVPKGDVAAAGWGAGVEYALHSARESKVKAVILEDLDLTARNGADGAATVPVLLSIAGKDPLVSTKSIAALQRRLHTSAPASEVKIYDDAERGFDDPSDSVHFRATDSDDLHQREIRFLAKHLTHGETTAVH